MRDIRKELIDILIAEVKPALGCTEPVAVALACAKAKELLGEEIVENRILVSPSIYKNGMCVGIPGTERLGLKIAVAMGFVGGHSENGLTVLETLDETQVRESEKYMDTTPIDIVPAQTKDKVFIEVDLRGKNNIAKVVIKEKHDNFIYLQRNHEILLDTGEYNQEVDAKAADKNTVIKKETFMDTTNVKEIVKNGLISSWFIDGRLSKYPSSVGVWNLKKDCLLKDYINFYSGGTILYAGDCDV